MEQDQAEIVVRQAVNDLVTLARKNILLHPYQSALRTVISYLDAVLPIPPDQPPGHTPDTVDSPVNDGAWLLVVENAPNTYISLHTTMKSAYQSIVTNFASDLVNDEELTPEVDLIELLADRGTQISLEYVPIAV